jgi:hypothetical protein
MFDGLKAATRQLLERMSGEPRKRGPPLYLTKHSESDADPAPLRNLFQGFSADQLANFPVG